MYKISFIGILFCILASCNSGKKEDTKTLAKEPRSMVDSLMEEVMQGHDAGMAKYGKMQGVKKQIQAGIDSLDKLSKKAQADAAPYRKKLESAGSEVNNAIAAMDKWMEQFNMDSALNNAQERIRYLTEEKLKVSSIAESIRHSLQKADSVLKEKF
jgi:DNA repair ATPase RecN